MTLLHVFALLLVCPLALSRHDDDFAFDNSDEFQVELTANHSDIAKNGLQRLWGVPDTAAYVGHLFRMEIPKEAFTGQVIGYKVRSADGRQTPSWLAVDSRHGLVSGVPLPDDIGPHDFSVTAYGRTEGLTATDSFTIDVKRAESKPESKYGHCAPKEKKLTLVILIDMPFHQITPKQRTRALMDLASFMALDWDEFWISPFKSGSDEGTILMGGGNGTKRRSTGTTGIYLNVGCGTKLWSRHRVLVSGAREQARDGSLAHVLRLPVLGWRVTARAHHAHHAPTTIVPDRPRRQIEMDDGSGDVDYGDEDEEEDEYSGDDEDEDVFEEDLPHQSETHLVKPHAHRHHHGAAPSTPTQTTFQTQPETTTSLAHTSTIPPTTLQPPSPSLSFSLTPSLTTETDEATTYEPETSTFETSTNIVVTEDTTKVKIEPFDELPTLEENETIFETPRSQIPRVGHSPVIIQPETEPPTTEPETQTVVIRPSNEVVPTATPTSIVYVTSPVTSRDASSVTSPNQSPVTSQATTARRMTSPVTSPSTVLTKGTTTELTETTLPEVTTQELITSSERSSTIIGRTTETVTFPMPQNQPPILTRHMKKLATTAGKAFRYIIPVDLFNDHEDGHNLTFTMYDMDNSPLSKDSWIQFIPEQREVYGLPLENQVSKWHYTVEARDSDGAVARAPLDITVQEHKSKRTFNHEFVMTFKLMTTFKYTIDWQIGALEGIVNLFRDTDMDRLTVLNVTTVDGTHEFVWTNDTLPKENCPIEDIKRLMKILESPTSPGHPSEATVRAMSPSLSVSRVWWRGPCAAPPPARPAPPRDTYPPVTRNQVDLLRATAGHLLRYRVPEDTFFDPEDGNTRNLNLSLRLSNRMPLPPDNWLQFDTKNQEFYGLPDSTDEGQTSYQLVAEDSSKKTAFDSLIVEVVRAPPIRPSVEFHMTVEYPFSMLADSAATKRRVVEKLAELFGDRTTENIRIQSITDDPTTIVWYNTSLPMDRCPKSEIEELRRLIITDEKGTSGGALKENVDIIFNKDLKVMSIRLVPLGLCADQQNNKRILGGEKAGIGMGHIPPGRAQPPASDGYTEYLVTFVIPAVVIVCMILVAGVIACVLYRRRKTGKMSVGDEEERQAFRSKGIPVIFQDELEERGDSEPVHKSPVIMREEKPPLLPPAPDYRTVEEAPYRPPPPFAPSHTPPRPKATPTYRKPPPYVPP